MRCFVHHDQEAVGVCRACGKGLCPDCAVDLGHTICCRACVQKAQELQAQIVRNELATKAQKRNRFFLPIYFIAFGVIGLYFGLSFHSTSTVANYALVIGAIFTIFGLFLGVVQHRLYKAIDRNLS
jgi:hypothetical protein